MRFSSLKQLHKCANHNTIIAKGKVWAQRCFVFFFFSFLLECIGYRSRHSNTTTTCVLRQNNIHTHTQTHIQKEVREDREQKCDTVRKWITHRTENKMNGRSASIIICLYKNMAKSCIKWIKWIHTKNENNTHHSQIWGIDLFMRWLNYGR